jgi:hypothetical protein
VFLGAYFGVIGRIEALGWAHQLERHRHALSSAYDSLSRTLSVLDRREAPLERVGAPPVLAVLGG